MVITGWTIRVFPFVISLAILGNIVVASESEEEAYNLTDVEEKYLQGLALRNAGKFRDACDMFEVAAKADYAKAQLEIGNCYRTGRGREKNPERALFWYRQAAKQGDRHGKFMLGIAYLMAPDLEKDRCKGFELLKDAWEGNHVDAGFYLSVAYIKGICVHKDYKKALEYMNKSATKGSLYSQVLLYKAYQKGLWGLHEDNKEAEHWAKTAKSNIRYSNKNGEITESVLKWLDELLGEIQLSQ